MSNEGKTVTGTVPSKEEVLSMLGEGIHTGLRKGTDAESAHDLWVAISNSNDGAWSDALDYALWGIQYMGYEIVKVEK